MLDLSISIVSFNNRALLKDCLHSIFEPPLSLRFEVFVVDNGSEDGSAEMARTCFPQVILIQNEVRDGYAANQNRALRLAKGRYLCILNDDVLICPHALERMVHYLDSHWDVGAVGPKILHPDRRTIQPESARQFPTLLTEFSRVTRLASRYPRSRFLSGPNMGYGDHDDTREVDCLLGACMMVRREAVEEAGFMDQGYFMYGEDVDWCFRIKQCRWKIVYLSEAQVIHYGAQSTRRYPIRMGIEALQSQHRFFRTHYGLAYALAYRGLILLISIGKGVCFAVGMALRRDQTALAEYSKHLSIQRRVIRWALFSQIPFED
jgi:GT2 family glycosyltransferase